jgi:uncharacterized protein (DUF1697 family)
VKYVAFFRNVNLGHPKSPTRIQLEEAFANAGAQSAQSFQTNGTLILAADNERTALKVTEAACRRLEAGCGLEEPVFICSFPHLAKLVADDPFAGVDLEDVYLCCASFMPSNAIIKVKAPLQSPSGDVEIIRVTSKTVLSIARKVGASPGSPTAFLEKMLCPVTTRS